MRPARPDDGRKIAEIAFACGLPPAWKLTADQSTSIAEDDSGIVAFCVLREIPYGLCIEDWWCFPTRAGMAGLLALGKWVESIAQTLVAARGTELMVGGVVRLDNPEHRKMLENRGYEVEAVVLAKRFKPAEEPPQGEAAGELQTAGAGR